MHLSELKSFLAQRGSFQILLPDGRAVPSHFHVTEVGEVTKNFIDCGGKVRRERKANLQLWNADDYDHRLAPGKLIKIVEIAEKQLGLGDLEIEVEFQGQETIQKFGLSAAGDQLTLTSTATACLALEDCGIDLSSMVAKPQNNACTPGGGCC